MKKILSAISVIVLSVFNIISPATYALEWESSSLCFSVEDGFITNYSCSETDITIPSSIDWVDIIWIWAQAFRWKWLTSLSIEEWVRTIWKWAFAENKLSSISLPSSLESIEEAAFNKNQIDGDSAFIYNIWSSRLVSYAWTQTSISIPGGTTSIWASSFRDMNITSVTIPNSVTSIGYMAFAGNELSEVTLPQNLLTIWAYAFERNNFSSINLLPNSLQEVDKEAFCDQVWASNVETKIARDFWTEFDNSCLNVDRIYNITFKDWENIISTWLLDDWETIEFPQWDFDWKWWFDGDTQYSEWDIMPTKDLILNSQLVNWCFIVENSIIVKYICDDTDIVIPDKVVDQDVVWIWTWVFKEKWVTSLTFQTTKLENIYKEAFAYNELTQVDIPNTVKFVWDSAFRSKDDDTSTKITSLALWNSIEAIWEHAFAYNRISDLNIPSSVERIEKWAFRDNKNIKNLIIPSNVKFIWDQAFRNNDEMTTLVIENGVEEIWTWAFYNDKIKDIIIPNSVKYIRDDAFRNNTYQNFSIKIWNGLEFLWQRAFCKWSAISPSDTPTCETKNLNIDSESLARLWWAEWIQTNHVAKDGPYLNVNSYTYYTVTFKDWDTEILSGKYLSWETISYPTDLRDNEKIFEWREPNPTLMPNENLVINAKWSNKATSGECFWTSELSDGTLQITSYNTGCGTDVVIPKIINWKKVTNIKSNSFMSKWISSVVIPYSVSTIWENVFRWNNNIWFVKIINPDIQFVPSEWAFWHGSGARIDFFVPEVITDLTKFQKAAFANNRWQAPYSISTWRLVYYKDWDTIIDAELYENNATLWDLMVLDDKEWYKFLWWNGIPADGKVTSNLNLTAIWRDTTTNITPDECFIVETKNSWWIPYTNIQWYKEFCWDEVIIPEVVNWWTVNVLSNSPFKNKNLKKIVLPETLVTIWQEWISYNSLLTWIDLPNSLQSIWAWAFRNDWFVWTLQLPNNITSLSENAFYGNKIDEVLIWENLNSIWAWAFCGRSDWLKTRALLPKSISEYPSDFTTQLDNACLDYEKKCIVTFKDDNWNIISESIYGEWDNIIIPDFDTDKAWYEFLWWRWLPSDWKAKSDQTITPLRKAEWAENPDECFIYDTDDYTLIDYVEWCWDEVVLPSKTKVLWENALKWKWVKSVTLNDGLQTILSWALSDNDLSELTLPSSVSNFDPKSLSWNPNLQKVRNSNDITPDSCFSVAAWDWKYQITSYNSNCGSDVIIPWQITSSSWWSVPTRDVWSIWGFGSSIRKIEIPNTVTRIAANTFYGAPLNEIILHDGINTVLGNAFGANSDLEKVYVWAWLLSNTADLWWAAFCKNSSDTTKRVWIVSSENYSLVTDEIRTKFSNVCVDLVPWYTVKFIDDNWDEINEKIYWSWETLKLPDVADNERWEVIAWKNLPENNIVSWDLTLMAIRKLVWDDTPEACFTIQDWQIVDYVIECGTDVVVPDVVGEESVKSIWNEVFKWMWLTSVKLPSWLETIWDSAFEDNNLKSLIISDSTKEIWDNAFKSNNLETLKLSNNTQTIWDSAFANNNLTAVRIPLSISTVWDSAFCPANNESIEWLISEDFPESKYDEFKDSCVELVKGLYLIIFDTAWWTPIPSIQWEYKDPITTTVANPSWEWHKFLGRDKSIPTKMPADDTIITALWEEIPTKNWYSWAGKRITTANNSASNNSSTEESESSQNSTWLSITTNNNCSIEGSTYSEEINAAYIRACENWIVESNTITWAKLWDVLNRAEMAKIISIFDISYFDSLPNKNKDCSAFSKSIEWYSQDMQNYMITSCQLERMWIHSTTYEPLQDFMPSKSVSRAEFWTVLSRILWWRSYEAGENSKYYVEHLNQLKEIWVLTNIDPNLVEYRSYVILMIYRAARMLWKN